MRAIGWNFRDNTSKIGTDRDPVKNGDDDLSGFMWPISKETIKAAPKAKEDEEEEDGEEVIALDGTKLKAVRRTAPFQTTILAALRRDGWKGIDDNYVHLESGSAQPYRTEFACSPLHMVFILDYSRLGR